MCVYCIPAASYSQASDWSSPGKPHTHSTHSTLHTYTSHSTLYTLHTTQESGQARPMTGVTAAGFSSVVTGESLASRGCIMIRSSVPAGQQFDPLRRSTGATGSGPVMEKAEDK